MPKELRIVLSRRSAATRYTLAFVLWSAAWVLISDSLLHMAIASSGSMAIWKLESIKGLVYVVGAGLLLWRCIRSVEHDEGMLRALDEVKLRLLKESGLVGVASWDSNHTITYVNETLAQMVGYSRHELVGMPLRILVPPEWSALSANVEREVMERGRSSLHKMELLRKDGSRVPIIGGRAVLEAEAECGIAYVLDICELTRSEADRKQLEEQLLHSEKLSALGRLAGGIAHDFNNQLGIIIGYTSMLERNLPDDENRASAEQVLKAADSAKRLIRQLLTFSRNQFLRSEIVDVNHVLTELQTMMQRLLDESIELRVKFTKTADCIQIDPSQLEQVLLNLVLNARDAMPNGGILTIELSRSRVGSQSAALAIQPGDYLTLRVSDTGVGIDESIKSKIFDPFFTTKEDVGGVGLGLAMVYGIVKQSGGAISVESTPGRGTSFILYFPHVPSKADASRSKEAPDEFRSVSGTILLAEDLAPLREVMAATLTAKGFRVLPARDGTDALALGRSNYRAIDLIIADIMMPGMKGPAAVRKIRELRSNIPTIFISGFADSAVLMEEVEDTDVLLEKPIAPEVLLATVYDVLRKSGRLGPALHSWRRDSAA